jgi:ornithine cyclodeaminase
MPEIMVLVEEEIRELAGFGAEELNTVEAVYPAISDGTAVMPAIMRLDVEDANGEVDVKTAHLPGHPGIAIKVSAGFFDNPSRGLPSLGGFIVVLDSTTGIPSAALFDNGYLTDLRTGLAGGVAAKHLASPEARTVAVIGAGAQARYQVRGLDVVMDIERVVVWARRPQQAETAIEDLASMVDAIVEPSRSIESACGQAGVVVTTTPATEGLVARQHLHPGIHVTAVGSDAEHKRELGPGVLHAADRVVVDVRHQSLRLGEARAAVAEGLDEAQLVELGEVIAGTEPGRTEPDQMTVCDLTGTGAQDTAIAGLVVTRAREAEVGRVIVT